MSSNLTIPDDLQPTITLPEDIIHLTRKDSNSVLIGKICCPYIMKATKVQRATKQIWQLSEELEALQVGDDRSSLRLRNSRNTETEARETRVRKKITKCLEGELVVERNESASKRKSVIAVEERNRIISPLVEKYWRQRYNLFSMYDEGIKMDEEGWFSVTPEEIATRHAERAGGGTIIDCFSGVGGNSIQFARKCLHVVAIDINPQKVAFALNNAKIYGVEDYIDFVIGDFFQLAPSLKADLVFLSPPWGGPTYCTLEKFTLDLLKPKDGYSIFQAAQKITPNIIMFLPRNVDLHQVEELSSLFSPPLRLEVEENYVQGNLKGITAYFGSTALG